MSLSTDLVASLRSIPELVSLVGGDPNNILFYEEQENGDPAATIRNLTPPKVLTVMDAVEWIAKQRVNKLWNVRYRIIARPPIGTDPERIFDAIANGVPTNGGGQSFFLTTINASYHPAEMVGNWEREFIPVSEFVFFGYWRMVLAFSSKTPDYPG